MSGGYYANILHKFFGFPSVRSCQYYKEKLRLKYDTNQNIFDGSIESIQKLTDLFLIDDDEENDQKRYVIAVDAAAVDAKMVIHKNGDVEGLVDDIHIDEQIYDLITSDLNEFHKFFNEHHDKIVKYYFVFYLCPLRHKDKSLPILLIKKTNGSADLNITGELEMLYYNCVYLGLDIVGISFDGNASYLKYVSDMLGELDDLYTNNKREKISRFETDVPRDPNISSSAVESFNATIKRLSQK